MIRENFKVYKALIVGAGMSGLTASIILSKRFSGEDIALIERFDRVGKKILSTGNGRCNITNRNINISHYHGENPSFAKYALETFGVLETEEFLKANIISKTVRIEENGRIKESMSFPAFKYMDLITQEWETSDLRETLESTKYLFFVFKKENDEYVFKGIKLWNMPEFDIETFVMKMWKSTYNTIKSGCIVKSVKNGIRKTNFISNRKQKY